MPVKILRNKQERTLHVHRRSARSRRRAAELQTRRSNSSPSDNAETQGSGFGLTLEQPDAADRAAAAAAVGQIGSARHRRGSGWPGRPVRLRAGDVILSVNRKPVSNAADAARELQAVASGRIAQILLWRGDAEIFVTVKKE